jgi:hypothetical protein
LITPSIAVLQQQNALQIALQQTNAVLQVSFRQNSALSGIALQQLNTLQTALQKTISLQGAQLVQSGHFSPSLSPSPSWVPLGRHLPVLAGSNPQSPAAAALGAGGLAGQACEYA